MSSRDVDHRTDIYALGVTLYELLAGVPPYDGETVAQLVAAVLQQRGIPLAQHRPDLPVALCDVVAKAIAQDRENRHGSAMELAQALAPFASPRGTSLVGRFASAAPPATPLHYTGPVRSAIGHQTTQAVTSPAFVEPGRTSRLPLAIAAVVLSLGLVATGAVWLVQSQGATTGEPEGTKPAAASPSSAQPASEASAPPAASSAATDAAGGAAAVASASASASTSGPATTTPPPPRPKTQPLPRPPHPPATTPTAKTNVKDSWP